MKRGIIIFLVLVILTYFLILRTSNGQTLPDLTVNFSFTPTNAIEGENIWLDVITMNIGYANSTNYTTRVLINGLEFALVSHSGLIYGVIEPGKNSSEAFNLRSNLTAGYSNITVITDYLNETVEESETNNELTKTIYVLASTNCIPNWTAINTNCTSQDTYTTWYNDTKACNNNTGKPANQTIDCDYNSNGIIGNFSSFSQTNLNLAVYINNQTANISQVFNTTKTIEFREGNITRMRFSYSFSQPLNMKAIEIIKQPSSYSFGYLIINGINITKNLTIDKLNENSSKVCIKNRYIENISEISNNCTGGNEYIVDCPGESDNFMCSISNDKFLVSGLTYSGVKEFTGQQTQTNCTTNWSCTSWGSCINNIKTRTCTDINNCNTTEGKPGINQSCVSCTTNWNCTSWEPEECPKNEIQTRLCTDKNNCGISTGKPTETQTCVYEEKKNWPFIIIIVVLSIFILAIVILIIYFLNKKAKQQYTPTTQYGYGQGQQPQYYSYRT